MNMFRDEFFKFNKIISLNAFENHFEKIELVFYALLGFFVPFFFGHPQILIGTIVNSMLVSAALYSRGYKLIPLALTPSLGVLASGMLFGNLTVFLVYLIPFIWIGNFLIIYGMKFFYLHAKVNYWISSVISSIVKAGFIFGSALVLVSFGIIPAALLVPMGLLQVETALAGCAVVFGVHKIRTR